MVRNENDVRSSGELIELGLLSRKQSDEDRRRERDVLLGKAERCTRSLVRDGRLDVECVGNKGLVGHPQMFKVR